MRAVITVMAVVTLMMIANEILSLAVLTVVGAVGLFKIMEHY